MHQYFDRKPSKWNIEDFLKECDSKTTRAKLSLYIKCLEKIVNTEEGPRREKALELLYNYREGDKADRKLARDWVLNCESEKTPSISIQNTFTGGEQTIGTVNDRTFIAELITSQKRNQEDNEVSTRQIKSKLRNMESGETISDYCELSDKVENEVKSDLKKTFDREYNKMKDNLKWKLKSTGRVVEDTLYECVPNFTSEHLIHSFTIDIDDPIIKGIFFPQELQEIEETNVKEDPDLSSKLYGNLARFCNKNNIEEIRKIMKEIDHEGYDFEADTLKYSVHSLVRQYERTPNAFSLDHYEAWYNINVWGPIIDRTFDNIPNVDIARKGDAIIRKLSGGIKLEFGGSEAGKHYEGQGATKWLYESRLKLPKMMRDMFISLCKNTDWNQEKMEKMETVGYIHGGLVLMIMTLDLPAGYITRINKSELYRIPEDIESFNDAIELITAVWKSKMRVVNTMALLNSTKKDVIVDRLRNVSTIKRNRNDRADQTNEIKKILPENQTTPEKAQKKDC
ncbi:5051_t:CDS:2 [Entrophospora sp. SA101]|nr:5051_t:CDS:2 [Entrophospora sp. SA101]